MEYLQGSHCGGAYEHVFRWDDPLGIPYPTDGEVERQIPMSQRKILEGPPGTLVFCDTAGFHRGGVSRNHSSHPGHLGICNSRPSLHGRRYETDASVQNARWSAPAKFAVA